MSKVFFSVVIPTFNQSTFLEKALESIQNQDFQNYETIVIDDYSTDLTEKVVKKFGTNKIKYIKKKNYGVIGASRNEGIKQSEGSWIAFLDSDDIWYPKRLERIKNFLSKNRDCHVVTTDEKIINQTKKNPKIWRHGPFKKNFYKHLLLNGNCVSTSATVVSKSFLDEKEIMFSENKEFVTVEDYDFFMKLAFDNAKFEFIHEVLGDHYYHKQSASSNYEKHKSAYKSVMKHHIFEIQNFTKNRSFLEKKLDANLAFMDIVQLINNEKNLFKGIMLFIKNFFSKPIYFNILVFKHFFFKQLNKILN